MSENLLSMESFLLLSLTLIPIGVLAIVLVCIICYNYIAGSIDDAYLNAPRLNQFPREICQDRNSTRMFKNNTDSEQFLVCMLNRQRHADIAV